MTLTPTISNILIGIAIVLGLIICMFGYKIFRLILAITGFILGATMMASLSFTFTAGQDIGIILVSGVAGGLITAILLLYLYSAGVFILGLLFGFLALAGALTVLNTIINSIFYLIAAILGGILAILLPRFMIIVVTSFTGALMSVVGTFFILNRYINPIEFEFHDISEIQAYRIILSWLALGTLGLISQYFIFNQKKEQLAHQETSSIDNTEN